MREQFSARMPQLQIVTHPPTIGWSVLTFRLFRTRRQRVSLPLHAGLHGPARSFQCDPSVRVVSPFRLQSWALRKPSVRSRVPSKRLPSYSAEWCSSAGGRTVGALLVFVVGSEDHKVCSARHTNPVGFELKVWTQTFTYTIRLAPSGLRREAAAGSSIRIITEITSARSTESAIQTCDTRQLFQTFKLCWPSNRLVYRQIVGIQIEPSSEKKVSAIFTTFSNSPALSPKF